VAEENTVPSSSNSWRRWVFPILETDEGEAHVASVAKGWVNRLPALLRSWEERAMYKPECGCCCTTVPMTEPLPAQGLTVRGLTKTFGSVRALDGLDLVVARGQLVGFLGPNGAGKTTAMRAILGLVSLDGGEITWRGNQMSIEDRRHIGYMPQERGLYPRMSVHEHIAYIGRLAGLDATTATERADVWSERLGLEDRKDDLIQELSTGNQQRVQLAVALVHEPTLLVLDEPFAGLDPVAVAMLVDVMADQVAKGVSVVFSSHQLDLVQDIADELTIVAAGTTRATGTAFDLRCRATWRLLRIEWTGDTPAWSPSNGTQIGARRGVSTFSVPADSDSAALIAEAAAAGAFASVSYEPPGLEEVFLEIVAP